MSWKSPYGPVEASDATPPALVRGAAAATPDRPALVDGPSGQVVGYGTLASRIAGSPPPSPVAASAPATC